MQLSIQDNELGKKLIRDGLLSARNLESAVKRSIRQSESLARSIADLQLLKEDVVYEALADISHLDFVRIEENNLKPELLDQFPSKLIFHYRCLPLKDEEGQLSIAFSDPPPLSEQGNLRLVLGKRLKIVIAPPSEIQNILRDHFGIGAEMIEKLGEQKEDEESPFGTVHDLADSSSSSEIDASMADFVDQILAEALRLRATDIHLEPYKSSVRLRYRIDGMLEAMPVPDSMRKVYSAVVSRLKILANADIAEKRVPQDGRVTLTSRGKEVDLRLSTIPTNYGEGICLRILGRENLHMELEDIGLTPSQKSVFLQMGEIPNGLILITGPTGSGKTTTLYAMLHRMNSVGRKIITIEDPVEYQLEGVSQINIREEIGLTFAKGLRSVLRHDPDVILVGEIRDEETANISVRAAQTGHTVLSTLHTNDSISAVTRLMEMNVDPHLLSSSLVASVAQRLAQKLCPSCRLPDSSISNPTREEISKALNIELSDVKAYKSPGCPKCNKKGYVGRIGIYEIFIPNDELTELFEPGLKAGQLRQKSWHYGWRPIRHNAWEHIHKGNISISELDRLTRKLQHSI